MSVDTKLFDMGVDRENTGCAKWDSRQAVFGRADVIPLWVADMDFAAPQSVTDVIIARAQHGAFGYCADDPADKQAVVDWMARRHATQILPEDIIFSPGVVDSMRVALASLAKPGDKIAINTPVYGPFYSSITMNGMEVVGCPMIQEGADWRMNYEALEQAFQDGAKVMMLCNPHNPVGRVWTREELDALVLLTKRYGVQLISDEIHADIEMPGHRNTCMLNVDSDAIVFISATKTFNLAALRHSSVLIHNQELREKFCASLSATGVDGINLFGRIAQTAAYQTGDEWLDALNQYLAGNRDAVEAFLASELPEITCARLQGTYLMWMDCRALGMEQEALEKFMVEKAGVGLISGTSFGKDGAGFMRVNVATPRKNVTRAMEQIKAAIRQR